MGLQCALFTAVCGTGSLLLQTEAWKDAGVHLESVQTLVGNAWRQLGSQYNVEELLALCGSQGSCAMPYTTPNSSLLPYVIPKALALGIHVCCGMSPPPSYTQP